MSIRKLLLAFLTLPNASIGLHPLQINSLEGKMRFSTRTRYGLRFLLRLAFEQDGKLVQLGQVAKEENISPGYLEQIVRALKPLSMALNT